MRRGEEHVAAEAKAGGMQRPAKEQQGDLGADKGKEEARKDPPLQQPVAARLALPTP